MTPDLVGERARHIADVCAAGPADGESVKAALVAAREIMSWAQAQHATLARLLDASGCFPEAAIAESSKCSLNAASKLKERADTLAETPSLADALADGSVTAGHIDAVTRGSKQLDDDQRSALFDRVDSLVDLAAADTVDQFARRVRSEVAKLQTGDGMDRLERQRRATRLNTWTDAEGMWNLHGRFDPVTGVRLSARLDHQVEALFAETVPQGCPTDPVEKQKFLAGHALGRLIAGAAARAGGAGAGAGGRAGRAEFVVMIDADANDQPGPVAEWPIPVEIPARVLADLAGDGDIHAVVVRNGVVLHAPGQLDFGRTTRLASRAQRRALRGLYRGCAIPGCSVSFDRCKLHHIIWWRHGGRTDLDNLLPVCTKHHSKIHHDGWVIELGPNRQLTLRLPDGAIHNTGPPNRRAA